MKDEAEVAGEEEARETLHFFAFLDRKGRIVVPTRTGFKMFVYVTNR
jgi:hypothetical protein